MPFTANVIGRVRPSGESTNGAFFDPSLCTLTDLAATSGTTTAPVVTSASYNFVAGDVDAYVFIASGTNWIPGWYKIASVAANAATLTATTGSTRLYAGYNYNLFNTAAGCATVASPTSGTWSVDYSQQNASVVNAAAGTSNASTTFTDAGALFRVSMIGNALRLASGTNGTVGYYFITAVASTTSLTLDRNSSTAAMTNGVWKIGGAAATCQPLLNSANATGDKVVAGNIVYILGAGTDTPASADYTTASGNITPVSGTSSAWVRVIGENGRPRIHNNGLFLHNSSYLYVENLYVYITAATSAQFGIINTISDANFINLVINTNDQAAVGLKTGTRGNIINCEILSGTTSPTVSSGSHGIVCGYGNVWNNNIHHMRDGGITDVSGASICGNIIWGCVGNGISLAGATIPTKVANNTIVDNEGHGINVTTTAVIGNCVIRNNIISDHTVAAKNGINIAAGTTLANNKNAQLINHNVLFNNTANYGAISGGPNDITGVNPEYTDAANGDFRIGTALKQLGSPSYLDPGALQRQEAGGGGVAIVNSRRNTLIGR